MIDAIANFPDETFQEGTAPVQAFASPAVRPVSGAESPPRLGRPSGVASKNSAVPLPTEGTVQEPVRGASASR